MQLSFTDVLRGQNARGRVRVSYFGVRKQVANCRLTLKVFKAKNNLSLMHLNVKNYISPRNNVLRA